MYVKAQVRIWSLGEFLESPMEALQPILHDIAPRQRRNPTEVPRMLPLDTLGRFLQDLRNQGMQPTLVGDLPDTPSPTLARSGPTPIWCDKILSDPSATGS